MNVIHALAWYFPDSTGGTEVYVSGLVNELSAFGVASTIVAAHAGPRSFDYVYEGVDVHRYAFVETADLAVTRGERRPQHFDEFVAWLRQQKSRIYHQHSWTTSCGLHHISAAKSLGFRTVLTIHVPGIICLRGTMLEFGSDPCDGRVDAERCASCWSHGQGLPRPAALALGRVPRIVSRAAYRSRAESRLLTAVGAREMASVRRRQILAIADVADRIVVVCGWLAEALRRNGVAEEKLVLSRQGVDRTFFGRAKTRHGDKDRFRIGFLGRCDPVKGLPVLLDAMDEVPLDLPLELVVHAVANTEQDRRYLSSLMARIAGDPRITFKAPVARAQLADTLAEFDMLAVPSQWKETGPIVVLEAQAVGVPVLGSDLGGIAELVSPGIDGHLVPHSDPVAWADAMCKAVTGRLPCIGQKGRSRPVRTMVDAAQDMSALYANVA